MAKKSKHNKAESALKINQKAINEHVEEIVDNALMEMGSFDPPEGIYDEDNDDYSMMVETLASDWEGVHQPDSIVPVLDDYVIGLDDEIEKARKKMELEEGEELSWGDEINDLVEEAADLVADALNEHPYTQKNKIRFYFGTVPDIGDYGLIATMEPAAFNALRKPAKKAAKGKKKNKAPTKPENYVTIANIRKIAKSVGITRMSADAVKKTHDFANKKGHMQKTRAVVLLTKAKQLAEHARRFTVNLSDIEMAIKESDLE
jgi:histone H3/H4